MALKYEKDYDPDADAGKRYDAVQVKMCNLGVGSDEGAEFIFSPLSWDLRDDDGTNWESFETSGPPGPDFGYDRKLSIDQCAKGWMRWEVDADAETPTLILKQTDESDLARWDLEP